jgi:hypothetical protein
MKFREIIDSANALADNSQNFAKHTNTLCGYNAENFNVERDGNCSYRCHLKSKSWTEKNVP